MMRRVLVPHPRLRKALFTRVFPSPASGRTRCPLLLLPRHGNKLRLLWKLSSRKLLQRKSNSARSAVGARRQRPQRQKLSKKLLPLKKLHVNCNNRQTRLLLKPRKRVMQQLEVPAAVELIASGKGHLGSSVTATAAQAVPSSASPPPVSGGAAARLPLPLIPPRAAVVAARLPLAARQAVNRIHEERPHPSRWASPQSPLCLRAWKVCGANSMTAQPLSTFHPIRCKAALSTSRKLCFGACLMQSGAMIHLGG